MNAKLLKILTAIKEFVCQFVCKDKCHTCEDCKKEGASENNGK